MLTQSATSALSATATTTTSAAETALVITTTASADSGLSITTSTADSLSSTIEPVASGFPQSAIIGIAVGAAVCLLALIGIAIVCWCKKRPTNAAKPHELQPAPASAEFQSARDVDPASARPASHYQSVEVLTTATSHYMSTAPDKSLLNEPTKYAHLDDLSKPKSNASSYQSILPAASHVDQPSNYASSTEV